MSAIPLAFVLPALIYIKLEDGPLTDSRKLKALGLAFFGITAAIVGSIMLFTNWSDYLNCNQGRESFYCSQYKVSLWRYLFRNTFQNFQTKILEKFFNFCNKFTCEKSFLFIKNKSCCCCCCCFVNFRNIQKVREKNVKVMTPAEKPHK